MELRRCATRAFPESVRRNKYFLPHKMTRKEIADRESQNQLCGLSVCIRRRIRWDWRGSKPPCFLSALAHCHHEYAPPPPHPPIPPPAFALVAALRFCGCARGCGLGSGGGGSPRRLGRGFADLLRLRLLRRNPRARVRRQLPPLHHPRRLAVAAQVEF